MGETTQMRGRAAARLAEEPLAPAVAGAVADDPAVAQFIRHLRDLKVMASLVEIKDGKAVIRRIHQSTNDRVHNYLEGGLY